MIDGDKQEEPYKLTLFGKSTGRLEVISADLLPSGDQLYILIADADSNIHILQFDPERTLARPPFFFHPPNQPTH